MIETVIIQRTLTNRVKRQLRDHERYWKRISVYKQFLNTLCNLDIIDYRGYWAHEGKINSMMRDKQNEYDRIMCIRYGRRRYGRSINCWLQNDADDERHARRLQSKLESQARYYGMSSNEEIEKT